MGAITVDVAAASTDLTTITAVKSALGISSTKFDGPLKHLIEVATSQIHEFVEHIFAKQTYTEKIAGEGTSMIMVTNTPIIGTPTILCEGSPITDFEVEDPEVGSLYRKAGWSLGDWVGWNTEPALSRGLEKLNFYVTYEAGYIVPDLDGENLPKHVEQACIETVVAWYRSKRRDPSIKRKQVDDLMIEYKDQEIPAQGYRLPSTARALLSRRVA